MKRSVTPVIFFSVSEATVASTLIKQISIYDEKFIFEKMVLAHDVFVGHDNKRAGLFTDMWVGDE